MNEISEGDVELVKKLYNCEEQEAVESATTLKPTVNPPILLTNSFTSSATVEPSTASTTSVSYTSTSAGYISQPTGKPVSSFESSLSLTLSCHIQ